MEARISILSLGVVDLERARRFYHDGMGWPLSSSGGGEIAFFRTGGVVLALYPKHLLAEDAGIPADGQGFGGITLAHNVREREEVDSTLAHAAAAGGRLVKPAADAVWGGRSGYFADPDGYLWEIAWNPHFPFAADGSLVLPE